MSARVMNPAMMTEMSRNIGGGGVVGVVGRASPNRAALARVRRDLFGPVDHAAARALAERELKAQSKIDSERWDFDFRLEIPSGNTRYDWQIIGPQEVIPEPYALRGMPYLRKQCPESPRKNNNNTSPMKIINKRKTTLTTYLNDASASCAERTPPQEPRVPRENTNADDFMIKTSGKKTCTVLQEPTTPVSTVSARKQTSITDFMKSRKRTLNGNTKKSIVEPPEKITRNAGQIRS
ncbi:hypothetical protein HCN44_004255 [Aphidius gifuensis]|uniref:Cyclin-dependent kinase inhibitor domain-containing protein n=1 Tax=Aphidius gifuensis TaxID=684658 RepID=A0A834XWG5_APHGI|nr:cyclin-dependent kinase inhibitor 1 [Aphidius gifuensis]KAF7994783.1 hypothetical protein HCN44_004255 [Aphidius gifuensis]